MFDFTGSNVYSGLTTAQGSLHFPDVLTLEDTAAALSSLGGEKIMLGVDGQGEPITHDLDADSPHILVTAATGGGKSVVSRSIAAQALVSGANVVFLDAKRHSHRWAKNLPGVHYASSLPDIGNALVSIGMELHRRNDVADTFAGPISEAPVGPRVVIIFEEMNATMAQLATLDKKLPKGTYTSADAIGDVMFLGRAAKMHMVGVAQFADARTMGGPGIRENFSTRVLIRYTKQSWTMLAYDCGLPQPAPEETGRGMVCRGGKARQTQFLYLTEEQAAHMVRVAHDSRVLRGEVSDSPSRREVRSRERELNRQAEQGRAALMRARGLS